MAMNLKRNFEIVANDKELIEIRRALKPRDGVAYNDTAQFQRYVNGTISLQKCLDNFKYNNAIKSSAFNDLKGSKDT